MKKRRCLVVTDGYYEWQTINKKKFPHYFQVRDQSVFALVGAWERWEQAEPTIQTFTSIK
jgi:putative SOS response-associated peptidase YedK